MDYWEYRGSGPRRGGFNAESQVVVDNGEMITAFYTRENDYVPALIMQQKWAIEK